MGISSSGFYYAMGTVSDSSEEKISFFFEESPCFACAGNTFIEEEFEGAIVPAAFESEE